MCWGCKDADAPNIRAFRKKFSTANLASQAHTQTTTFHSILSLLAPTTMVVTFKKDDLATVHNGTEGTLNRHVK